MRYLSMSTSFVCLRIRTEVTKILFSLFYPEAFSWESVGFARFSKYDRRTCSGGPSQGKRPKPHG